MEEQGKGIRTYEEDLIDDFVTKMATFSKEDIKYFIQQVMNLGEICVKNGEEMIQIGELFKKIGKVE